MIKNAFYYVDDLKIKIEQLLKHSELNSLDSHSREILKLVYKHLDSIEETAKATLPNEETAPMIISEVDKLRGIVAQIGSVQFSGGEEEFNDDDDVKDANADDDDDDADKEIYGAFYFVDDLKNKIEKLLKPSELNSLDSKSREILKLVYKHVDSFEETAKKTLPTDLQTAQMILSEVRKLRGIVAQIGSVQFSGGEGEFQVAIHDVENLKQRFQSFKLQLKMEEQRSFDGLYNFFPDDEEEEYDCDAATSKMIGVCDVYKNIKDRLMSDYRITVVTTVVGMSGIGKTTLANKVFHDPMIVERFDHRVLIRLGKKYRVKDIPRRILAEINPDMLSGDDDEEVVHEYLKACLKSKSYLIVLDDVWDNYVTYLLHPFYRYEMHELDHPFLHLESASRILLTSRLQQLYSARQRLDHHFGVVTTRLLNEEESWGLLCDKIFCCNGLSCPSQLEKAGKKISKKCEGLPLTILTVAHLLSQEEESTPEYWNEVADKKNHQLFLDAFNEIAKVLLPSYTYLSPLLKMCFLYIGLFPQNYEVPRSRLINLWRVDRFLELNVNINSYLDAIYHLEELVLNSVVMVYKTSTYNLHHTVKSCGLHSSLWHLAKQKDSETKFALIISSPDDCLEDGMKGCHRLSIHSNVLFAMKDVHKSVEDNCASTARSLLCFGLYHQYQVPLCFRLKLLRELDALSIRFYEFPMEVLQLVRLNYLSLTSNGMIPTSICQLQSLEFFIIDRHQSIRSSKDTSYLPMEIWNLSELKLLQVMGSDLPDPHGASLDNLRTLSKVSARSCTEVVLKGVPNLEELNIHIELVPYDDGKPFNFFAHISCLSSLESLKCVIVNPRVVPPVVPFSNFHLEYLVDLSLSGLGFPWKEMRKIASLPNLRVLKLKNYAFQGPVWKVDETKFIYLASLVIEDTDMVEWHLGFGAFKDIHSVVIKNCYKLEKIYGKFGSFLSKVEIVDCNPLCIKEMKNASPKDNDLCVLSVHSSWDDGKLKT